MQKTFEEHRISVSQGLSSGNRMYTKGIKMIENKDRMIMQAKVYKDHDEIQDCSFKPEM